jgi:hypothetical protein
MVQQHVEVAEYGSEEEEDKALWLPAVLVEERKKGVVLGPHPRL